MDYSHIIKNFETHGFSARAFPRKEDAVQYFVETLDKRTIGFGGSVTLREMGLYEALSANNVVAWHNRVGSFEVRQLAACTRVYITSANAVTESGEIVNIDGTGNRVAMTSFGPEICFFVVGKNKIVPTVADALHRCRNIAAPLNAKRLNMKTPCAAKGDKCYDCNSPDRICRVVAIHERALLGMKSEIVFVDEDLGY